MAFILFISFCGIYIVLEDMPTNQCYRHIIYIIIL